MSGDSGVPTQYREILENRNESELSIIFQNTKFYDNPKYNENGNLILEVETLDTPNVWETIGDAASVASLELNIASLGCAFVGAYPVAGTCSTAAAIMDTMALGAYFIGDNEEKTTFALVSVLADSIPLLAPGLKAAYNPVAQRFINETTKRFIPTTAGLAKYYTWPSIGVEICTGSSFLAGESEWILNMK